MAYAPVVVEWISKKLAKASSTDRSPVPLEGVTSSFLVLLLHVVYPLGTGVVFLGVGLTYTLKLAT